MSETWNLFRKKKPPKSTEIWVAFYYEEKRWPSDKQREIGLCIYEPDFIVSLCEEDEGSWKGMSSISCDAAFAWRNRDDPPSYPKDLEEQEELS